MERREFITLLGGAAATWPLIARAQQADRIRRIGVLMAWPETEAEAQTNVATFRKELEKLGWTGGPQHPDRHSLGDIRRRGVGAALREGSHRNRYSSINQRAVRRWGFAANIANCRS